MFGQVIKKHCTDCNKDVQELATAVYSVGDIDYVEELNCPDCGKDLAGSDRQALKKAQEEGKSIYLIIC